MTYNLLNVTGIDFKSYPLTLPSAAADIIPALAAGTALELQSIVLSGDATTGYDATIAIKKNGGTSYTLINAVTIAPKQTVTLPIELNLEAGDSLTGFASTAAKLTAVATGKLYT